MRVRHLLLMALMGSVPAYASFGFGVDVGGGYWAVDTGKTIPGIAQFDAHVSLGNTFGKHFFLGVRPGFMVHVAPGVTYGLPIDAQFRFKFAIVYAEVLGGLAYLINDPSPVRAHVAIGAGFTLLGFTIGVEGGYLQSAPQVLGRIGFMF